jgi:hypothetical protein
VGAFLVVSEEILDEVLAVELGFSSRELGALFAAAYLSAAVAAHLAHRLERRLGARPLVFGMALVAAATLVASPRIGLVGGGLAFLLRHAMRSVHDTVVAGRLAAVADSTLRATVLSIYHAARSVPYVTLAWGIGAAMDRVTARGFALGFGIAMAIATAAAWLLSTRRRATAAWSGIQ